MNTSINKLETCRQLIAELRWNERNAEKSARIAVSKALWLGIDKQEVMQLIRTLPSDSYLQACPHILTQTWEAVSLICQPRQQLSELEQLLNALN